MKKTILFVMTCALLVSCNNAEKQQAEKEAADLLKKEIAHRDSVDKAIAEMAYKWRYESSTDEMTGKTVSHGNITSKDIASLDFPYEGGTTLTLQIRNQDGKNEAFIVSSNGQINDDFSNPILTVRFDEDPPVDFSVSTSSDNDPKIRFIASGEKFINRLKKSKTTKIQVEYFNNGRFVFNFDTADLKWEF